MMNPSKKGGIEKWHLEKSGAVGSIIAALCCVGFGPLIAFFTAIGAGFLVNDAVLAPLLLVALIVGGVGLAASYRSHRKPHALILHGAGGLLIFGFTFVIFAGFMVWTGIGLLLSASIVNLFQKRSCDVRGGQRAMDAAATAHPRCTA